MSSHERFVSLVEAICEENGDKNAEEYLLVKHFVDNKKNRRYFPTTRKEGDA